MSRNKYVDGPRSRVKPVFTMWIQFRSTLDSGLADGKYTVSADTQAKAIKAIEEKLNIKGPVFCKFM